MGYSRIAKFNAINFSNVDKSGVLGKYSKVQVPDQKIFTKVPNNLILGEYDLELVGMYVFLAVHAGPSPIHGSRRIQLSMVSYVTIARGLGSSEKHPITNKVAELIVRLAELDFVNIVPLSGATVDIIINQDSEFFTSSFTKVYPLSTKRITNHSRGLHLLKVLGMYATFRSMIYESELASVVVSNSPSFIAKRCGVSVPTVSRHLGWLREHGIIAYYKCVMNSNRHNSKYYYSDFHDCHNLTQTVAGYIYQGVIKTAIE